SYIPEAEVVAIHFCSHADSAVPGRSHGSSRAVQPPSSSFARLCRRMKGLGWVLGLALTVFLAPASWAQSDIITEINVQGNRRIPSETVKARVFTHPGDIY